MSYTNTSGRQNSMMGCGCATLILVILTGIVLAWFMPSKYHKLEHTCKEWICKLEMRIRGQVEYPDIWKQTALISSQLTTQQKLKLDSERVQVRNNSVISYLEAQKQAREKTFRAFNKIWCDYIRNDIRRVEALTNKVEAAIKEKKNITRRRVEDYNEALQALASSDESGLESLDDISAVEIKRGGSCVGPKLFRVTEYDYPDASEVMDFIGSLIDSSGAYKKHNLLVALQIEAREREIEVLNNVLNDHEEHITLETALKEKRARRKASAELACNVTYVNRDYGFIHINAGAKSGKNRVLKGSQLTVMRGNKKVCDLIVTQVTDTEAIAYVQNGTLGVRDKVQVGDRVIAKKD